MIGSLRFIISGSVAGADVHSYPGFQRCHKVSWLMISEVALTRVRYAVFIRRVECLGGTFASFVVDLFRRRFFKHVEC